MQTALRMGSVRTETLKMAAHMPLSTLVGSTHDPHHRPQTLWMHRTLELEKTLMMWFWDFPSLPLRGLSPRQNASRGHSSRKYRGKLRRWGAANSAPASHKAAILFTPVNSQVLHFILFGKGVPMLKRDLNAPALLCSLHLADEKIEAQRSK